MKDILEKLGGMPIFKMSLGSKELFHSNFLEFLWEIDNDMFIRIVNKLLPKTQQLNMSTGVTYILSREKENFDICIFHEEKHGKQTKTIYDLVLENKVKSMPRMDQLNGYVDKIQKLKQKSRCRFVLLSLVTSFPDKKVIRQNWTIVDYLGLKTAIESEKMNWPPKAHIYIEDYCGFIEKMNDFQKAILHDFSNSKLFQDVDLCSKYRLHDLYIKLRCDKFLIELQKRLEKNLNKSGFTVPIKFISNYNEIKTNNGTQGIYLNAAMNQGAAGQAAAFIHLHDNLPVNNYEIVIQGKQYRHGINSEEGKAQDKVVAQEQIWNRIGQNNQDFLDFKIKPLKLHSGYSVQPSKCKNVKNCQARSIPLNGYEKACIYKHIDMVDKTTVGVLLNHMAKDIINTILIFK